MSHIKQNFIFLFLVISFPSISIASTWDNAYIENFAKNYIYNNTEMPINGKKVINISKIDPRIIIKPCNSAIVANMPQNTTRRNITIKISCNDAKPWQIYLSAKIEIQIPALVAISEIAKGSTLDENNIGLSYIPQFKIRGETMTDKNLIFGSKAKRRISKGKLITHKSICLICKGDMVTIVAKSSSFTIKTQGIALSSGNLNEQISVKNKHSGKILRPKVKAMNQVIINL